jgi:hypothetical protein
MKQTEMIALGLAAVAVYLIVNPKKTTGTSATAGGTLRSITETVSEIFDAAGGAFSNGWRYFNDGTAIDPQGNYYQGGQLIWTAPGARWSV